MKLLCYHNCSGSPGSRSPSQPFSIHLPATPVSGFPGLQPDFPSFCRAAGRKALIPLFLNMKPPIKLNNSNILCAFSPPHPQGSWPRPGDLRAQRTQVRHEGFPKTLCSISGKKRDDEHLPPFPAVQMLTGQHRLGPPFPCPQPQRGWAGAAVCQQWPQHHPAVRSRYFRPSS